MKKTGLFISFEGGEGCGKSTQLPLLAAYLRAVYPGREIIETRSPGGTAAAEKIRAILKEPDRTEDLTPETELLLFGACHAQMVRSLIRPALERGAILLTDRFCDSTLVYQGFARGLDAGFIRTINRFSCGGTVPDLTFYFDLAPGLGVARTRRRAADGDGAPDRFDSETAAFHERVRAGFLQLANEEPERFAVIDAAGSIDAVRARVQEVFHERLG